MEIRNIKTSSGLLSFKRLSDADLQLTGLWKYGVVFGPLYIIELRPSLYCIYPREPNVFKNDFVVHLNCKTYDLVKLCNYTKNNYYKFSDFISIVRRFNQINVVKYVFESITS